MYSPFSPEVPTQMGEISFTENYPVFRNESAINFRKFPKILFPNLIAFAINIKSKKILDVNHCNCRPLRSISKLKTVPLKYHF